tara:strand:- start:21700 stop:24828 length:3129 start_codon:yes stop_codon:yes gene_type:complete
MATKKFVPRGNNEGGLGDATRRWKNVHAATGSFYNGLSGSLQTLTDGSSYLVEGSNITISTGSSGQVTIAAAGGGTMSSFTVNSSNNGSGSPFTISNSEQIDFSDGTNTEVQSLVVGASKKVIYSLKDSINLSNITASNGIQIGSTVTHELTNNGGTLNWRGSPITAGAMTSFKVTGSHDVSSEISVANSNTLSLSGSDAISVKSVASSKKVTTTLILDGTTLQQSSTGLKVNPSLTLDNLTLNGKLKVDGTTTTIDTENLLVRDRFILLASGTTQAAGEPPVQGGIIVASGALGTAQSLIFGASGSMWHATQGDAQNGIITSIPPSPGSPSPYVPLAASEFRLSGSNVRKLSSDGTNVILTSGGKLQLTGTSGIDVKNNTIFRQGLTGSLQTLADGSSYLVEGSNISIATASNGQVTISSTGGGGSNNIWFDQGSDPFIIRPVGLTGSLGLGGTGTAASGYDIFLSDNGSAVFNEQGNSVDFRIESDNSSSMFFVDGSENRIGVGLNTPLSTLHIKEANATVRIQRSTNANSSSLEFAGQAGHIGAIVHQAGGNDLIFRTHNGTTPEEMLRLGSHYGSLNRQVILLSGSGVGTTSMQPKQSADLNFFVSGSIGSRGTSTKGTAVFGGDLHVSGNLTVDGTSPGGSGGSVAADDVTLGDAAANFKTSTGDINISGSNIGITGSNMSFFGDGSIPLKINASNTNKYSLQFATEAITFDSNNPKLSLKSTGKLRLDVNDTIELIHNSTQPAGSIELTHNNVEFRDSGDSQTIKYNTDSITLSKIVTASLGVSSSLHTFKNQATSQTFEDSQLINITGSLFWKNPNTSTELKLLSGSEGGSGGVNFTTGDGVHLNDSNVLTASLLETGNLRFSSNKLDIKEDVSITNLTASNAVSSSLYTFKDVGNGTSSNYSNQLYNVTGTLYWNSNDQILSGTLSELKSNLLPSINSVTVNSNPNQLSSNDTGNIYMLNVTVDNQDLTLENYSSFSTGYSYIVKNKSSTNSVNIVPTHSQYIDGTQNASASLQPLSSYTLIYSNDASWGWIIT